MKFIRNIFFILITCACWVLLPACAHQKPVLPCQVKSDNSDSESLGDIEHLSPEIELEKAITRHDFRYVAIMGYGIEFPGQHLKDPNVYYAREGICGYRLIGGTSDVVTEKSAPAREYARKYNELLEKSLIQGTHLPVPNSNQSKQ